MVHSVVEDGGIGLLLASHSQLSGGFQTHCFPTFCHPSAIQCTTNWEEIDWLLCVSVKLSMIGS